MIERNIENLSKTINENLEKQSENIERKMLLSLKKVRFDYFFKGLAYNRAIHQIIPVLSMKTKP